MATLTDPALVCPKCGESIALTESLAAPLVAATRSQYEQQLAAQAKKFADEKKTVAVQQGQTNGARRSSKRQSESNSKRFRLPSRIRLLRDS